MAVQIPLNTFRLVASRLQSGSNLLYQETTKNVSTIILSAVVANLTNEDRSVSVEITSGSVTSSLLRNAIVPPSESLNPFIGRMVLEKTNGLYFITDTDDVLDCTVSLLENAND